MCCTAQESKALFSEGCLPTISAKRNKLTRVLSVSLACDVAMKLEQAESQTG